MPSPIKANLKTEIIPVIMILASLAVSFYFYANFPDLVPTHWNYRGQIDGWSSKGFAAFFFPLFNLALYLLFLGIPYLDPKKDRYAEFAKPYHIFKASMVTYLTLIYFYVGAAGLGYDLPVVLVVPAATGISFMILGNYFGKLKPNWFMGIRTPWTLSNEEVWNKTHRLGGKLFLAAGLFLVVGTVLPPEIFWYLFLAAVLVAALVPIVYSYILYRRLEKNK